MRQMGKPRIKERRSLAQRHQVVTDGARGGRQVCLPPKLLLTTLLSIHLFLHLCVRIIVLEYLLCAGHCFRPLENSNEQNSQISSMLDVEGEEERVEQGRGIGSGGCRVGRDTEVLEVDQPPRHTHEDG